ncbi:urocortin [Motacilla alba alba]|uniref:urocortin n=1 Tax=Motacilla alba alba TaxID=1094192 RepID=UPI0018D59568|nr:urocortin [Motacilla alba alba]
MRLEMRRSRERDRGNRGSGGIGETGVSTGQGACSHRPRPRRASWVGVRTEPEFCSRNRRERAPPLPALSLSPVPPPGARSPPLRCPPVPRPRRPVQRDRGCGGHCSPSCCCSPRPPPAAARPATTDGSIAAAGTGDQHQPLWPPLAPPPPGPWRGRRDEPPLSIDLTFHLLRHLLLLARAQSQRARADSNRRILDAVGR